MKKEEKKDGELGGRVKGEDLKGFHMRSAL